MAADITTSAQRSPGWLLDEVASAGRENLDAEHVARYDVKEDADADTEVAVLERLGLDDHTTVIDVGAGTGQFTLAAARVASRVIAVDVSPVMIRHLQSKLAAAGLTNVDVVHAGFLSYQHSGRPADFVYSRFALHHLPDFWKAIALARVRSALRRDGVLRLWDVVYNFDLAEAEERIEAWCATGADEGEIAERWSRAEIEEHVRDEHSTFTWLLEPMIEQCGFTIDDAEYSPDGFFAKYLARAS